MTELPGYRVVLINPDDQTERLYLVVEKVLADYTTERVNVHRVPRATVSDFDSLDHQLRLIGYRRTGDWYQMPGIGGVASVEPLSPAAPAAEPSARGLEPTPPSSSNFPGPAYPDMSDFRVLAQTHGSMARMSWAEASRRDLVDGILDIAEAQRARALMFTPRGGLPEVLLVSDIYSVDKRGSGLNIVVDVGFIDGDGDRAMACLVGPRGRMKKIFAAAGYPL